MHGSGAVTTESLRRARGGGSVERADVVDPSVTPPPDAESPVVDPPLADPRARLLDEGAGWLDAAVDVERGLAQLAGARARALASFARCRPSSWDRLPGEPGAASAESRAARPAALAEVSEWAIDEVAARLRISGRAASDLLAECVELVEQLPATQRSLAEGEISWAQARTLVELLRPLSVEKKAAVEARVLPRAPRQTVAQLRECTRRAVARVDAEAGVQRLAAALRGRRVDRHLAEEGMSVLTALLPTPVARACHDALRAHAEACALDEESPPDPRSLDERMADCLADLILRPDAEGRSPVQVLLTVVARAGTLTGSGPDADEPGEIEGETVPAALVRELTHALHLLPRPARRTSPAEREVADEEEAPEEVSTPEREVAEEDLAALLDVRRLAGTALAERPRIAVVDELEGCLLALTDTVELRQAVRTGRGLGAPGETDGYRPSRPLDRFVRLRDRRCRFPGCRARVRRGDLDHRVPFPLGPTAHTNLEGLCEHHHRLSHQAPGWQLGGAPDGGLVWTLPGGVAITTVPPPFGTDDGSASAPTAGDRLDATGPPIGPGRSGAEAPPRWSDLTAAQRRERIRALIDPRVSADHQRSEKSPAPF